MSHAASFFLGPPQTLPRLVLPLVSKSPTIPDQFGLWDWQRSLMSATVTPSPRRTGGMVRLERFSAAVESPGSPEEARVALQSLAQPVFVPQVLAGPHLWALLDTPDLLSKRCAYHLFVLNNNGNRTMVSLTWNIPRNCWDAEVNPFGRGTLYKDDCLVYVRLVG